MEKLLRIKDTAAARQMWAGSMDIAELQQQWQQWIEKNIGGPRGRVEIAMQAAMNALSQGRTRDEAAAAARQAASSWKETGVSEPRKVTQQWRSWAEQAIGGSAERIEAALQAATAAIDSGKHPDEIVAAARDAALAWDSQDQQEELPISEEELAILAQARDKVIQLQQQQRAAPAGSTLKIPQGVFVGHVTNLEQRLERRTAGFFHRWRGIAPADMVWSFRLEPSAADGTRLPTVDVELRSASSISMTRSLRIRISVSAFLQ